MKQVVDNDFKGHIEFVAQNVATADFGDPVFKPYTIREINGVQVGIVGQAGLLLSGESGHSSNGLVILLGRAIVAALFASIRQAFFLHARAAVLRGEFDEACRRLFLGKEEPRPGELHLIAKGMAVVLRLWAVGPFSLVLFPRPPVAGKLLLFHDWFRKRYPGPIPRIRVSLNRR